MRVDRFDFSLPEDLIAETPASPRDSARLLVIRESPEDRTITDLVDYLQPGDVMVFNNTKVIPAYLQGKRDATSIHVTLHQRQKDGTWSAFAKPAKKLKSQDVVHFAEDFYAHVQEKRDNGEIILQFNAQGQDFDQSLARYGITPLPPYIARKRTANQQDSEAYQTIYAQEEGAVAAPTAGLHFTDQLFNSLDKKGIQRVFLTLHVGAGTFLPVKAEDTSNHTMHSEWYHVDAKTCDVINQAKQAGNKIIAVGTTSLRTLESVANDQGLVQPGSGDTRLFITPGYHFKLVDRLFTNFHTPRSTLFMLVCAFAGEKQMHEAYQHAITQRYRFYSYGDACLLDKNEP